MRTVRCALIEGHSWPQLGDPNEAIYGFRHYRLGSNDVGTTFEVDVLDLWQPGFHDHNCFLIADELCNTRLPFYVPRGLRVALLKESPNSLAHINAADLRRKFPVVFSHLRRHVDLGPPFHFLPFSSNFLAISPYLQHPQLPPVAQKTELCSFIGNLTHDLSIPGYQLRREVYQLVCHDARVQCFGLDTRPISTKREGLEQFAFSIAMENAREDYYFTEKLIDCLLMGTIPLYWGCPSIRRFFDPDGILCFSSLAELSKLIDGLSLELYRRLRPYVERNFLRAIEGNMADYHGYLHRALSSWVASMPFSHSKGYKLCYGPGAKTAAYLRRVGGQ